MRTEASACVLVATVCVGLSSTATASEPAEMPSPHEMMRWSPEVFVLSELLEYAPGTTERRVQYDAVGWAGGAYNRVWAKADGSQSTRSLAGDTELQLLFGRLIAPFWDLQIGARFDLAYGGEDARARARLALGLQGLAPGEFELEPTLLVGLRGDVAASLTASYDLLLTQRLVAQARLETAASVQALPELGVGAGIHHVDLGLRVRFELMREVAPYVGISWERLLMETATLARGRGEPVSELSFVLGVRLWY